MNPSEILFDPGESSVRDQKVYSNATMCAMSYCHYGMCKMMTMGTQMPSGPV